MISKTVFIFISLSLFLFRIHQYDPSGRFKQQIPISSLGAEDHNLGIIKIEGQQYLAMSPKRDNSDIKLYSLDTGEMVPCYIQANPDTDGHEGNKLRNISLRGEIVTFSDKGDITLLQVSKACVKVRKSLQSNHGMINVKRVCRANLPEHGRVIITSSGHRFENGELRATSIATQETLWKMSGEVKGCIFNPRGICTDGGGLLYTADGHNHRILVIQAATGNVLQVLQPPELRGQTIRDLSFCQTTSKLFVQHDYDLISCFHLQYRV